MDPQTYFSRKRGATMSFSTWHRRLDIARHDSHIEGSWHRFSSRSWALVSMGLAIMMIAVGLAASTSL